MLSRTRYGSDKGKSLGWVILICLKLGKSSRGQEFWLGYGSNLGFRSSPWKDISNDIQGEAEESIL